MIDFTVIQQAFSGIFAQAITFIPRLLTTIIILLIGWFISRFLSTLIKRIAERVGLDGILQHTGISGFLDRAQIESSGGDVLALIVFWTIFLNFLLIGLEYLGLQAAVDPLRNVIGFLPRLISALVMLVLGALVAQFLGRTASAAMASMGVEFHQQVGQIVNSLILIMVVIVILQQLGLDASIMINIVTAVIVLTVAGFALAFGFGGQNVARNVLAGYYAREYFDLGDTVLINGEEGTLEGIGTLNAEIQMADKVLIIPNVRLTEEMTVKKL